MAEPKVVLIVEDNEDNRIVYATILEHNGYRVLQANNGPEGIRLARERMPDLILMDMSIPVIDGWTATRELKEDAATGGIPIIALTAHALDGDRERAREAGCDAYLSKPCDPRDVLAEVRGRIGGATGTGNGSDAGS